MFLSCHPFEDIQDDSKILLVDHNDFALVHANDRNAPIRRGPASALLKLCSKGSRKSADSQASHNFTHRCTPAEFFLTTHIFPSLPFFLVPSFTEVADSDGDGRSFLAFLVAVDFVIVFFTALFATAFFAVPVDFCSFFPVVFPAMFFGFVDVGEAEELAPALELGSNFEAARADGVSSPCCR